MGNLPTDTSHRPWPLPRAPWVMAMRWEDLAFLHWPVAYDALRPLVPRELELERHGGKAWLGITPFVMSKVRARFMVPVPGLSAFPELNVRTYVTVGGKPGVWFFSLDAESMPAVKAARWVFGLPYHRAAMAATRRDEGIGYRSRRRGAPEGESRFEAFYKPDGPAAPPEPDSLEHWLTERYCLYSVRGGRLYRGEIHHAPWPLQATSVELLENTMTIPLGVPLDPAPPVVHFSKRLDVVAWLPSRVEPEE